MPSLADGLDTYDVMEVRNVGFGDFILNCDAWHPAAHTVYIRQVDTSVSSMTRLEDPSVRMPDGKTCENIQNLVSTISHEWILLRGPVKGPAI